MAETKAKGPIDRLSFGNIGKLGLIGTIATIFLRQAEGREMIMNLAQLTGHSLERIGIEGGPVAKDVEGWLKLNYQKLLASIFRAVVIIVTVSALSLLAVAYVEWGWVRGLIGTFGIVMVAYVTHDLWVRWIPVFVGVGVAGGMIEEASAKSITDLLHNPFQVAFGGIKAIKSSISWVLEFWKWMARVCIWYSVGVLYITLVPLHNTPGLIPMALPVIPLFFLIPLAEPWKTRGTQYTWIMWACLFWLVNLIFLAVFPDELFAPILEGSLWARMVMMGVIAIQASVTIRLSNKTQQSGESTLEVYTQPRGKSWIEGLMKVLGLFGLIALGAGLLNKYALDHTMMIPSNWLFDGNQTMNVIVYSCIGIGVVGVIISILGSSSMRGK